MRDRAPGPALRLVRNPAPAAPAQGVRLDDDELVSAVRGGDATAATAFYRRLHPRVASTVRRLLGRGTEDMEDLAQVAMMSLIDSLRGFRGECSLDTWATTVTARVVYKHIRRRRYERDIFVAADPESDACAVASVGRRIVARDYASRIRSHLGAMDPDRAWAFLLHDVCGFDLREIGEITGVSVAAAQKRLVRGRSELHGRLAADPDLADVLAELEGEA